MISIGRISPEEYSPSKLLKDVKYTYSDKQLGEWAYVTLDIECPRSDDRFHLTCNDDLTTAFNEH